MINRRNIKRESVDLEINWIWRNVSRMAAETIPRILVWVTLRAVMAETRRKQIWGKNMLSWGYIDLHVLRGQLLGNIPVGYAIWGFRRS